MDLKRLSQDTLIHIITDLQKRNDELKEENDKLIEQNREYRGLDNVYDPFSWE